MFNQGDTLAELTDRNIWEGECARGDDGSMQRWSCQVSGWLILASVCRGRFWTRVSFSPKQGAKYRGCDPEHMPVRPDGTVIQRGVRGQLCHVPQQSAYGGFSAPAVCNGDWSLVFLVCLLSSFPLMHVYIPQMFNVVFQINEMSRWVSEELVAVYTTDVTE